jgi:hypothetical protein
MELSNSQRKQMGALLQNLPHRQLKAFLPAMLIYSLGGIALSYGAEGVGIKLDEPRAWQVIQRQGFDPIHAHANNAGGAALGFADVGVRGTSSVGDGAVWSYRLSTLKQPAGKAAWKKFDMIHDADKWHGKIRVPAGGWYRLEFRAESHGKVVAETHVAPFGVGEVFVVAGQSYAAGANDKLLKVEDPEKRVAAFDPVTKLWQVANDPQPIVGDGGTIWPPLGDLLAPLLRVPVGFVNVAESSTASRQWVPGEKLYKRLSSAGKDVGRFRFVLWQQGESDVIENTPAELYVRRLSNIRRELAREWGLAPPWLLAQSTFHPTVYDDPEQEGTIRSAIGKLWTMNGFRAGPDTDILGGENRAGRDARRHFTAMGQRRAALLWFAAIWQELNHPRPE